MTRNPDVAEDQILEAGIYTVTDAAKLAGTTFQNVHRWLQGYAAFGHGMKPVFSRGPRWFAGEQPRLLSFLEVVELSVAVAFRHGLKGRLPVQLDRVRAAHEYARERLRVSYPFASLQLKSVGGHILREFEEAHLGPRLVSLSHGGQITLPRIVLDELNNLDYNKHGLAYLWHPNGRDVPIVVNPAVGSGNPTIEGTGVTVFTLQQRHRAGDSPQLLAQDYDFSDDTIAEALAFAA
jgi:uncharacterized protein (DUF433 family)